MEERTEMKRAIASAEVAQEPEALFGRGEVLLMFGTLILAFAVAITHFVMGMMFAPFPAMIALPLLAVGIERARNPTLTPGRAAAGLFLLLLALCAAVVFAFKACSLSYDMAYRRPGSSPPELSDWFRHLATWFIPAGLTAIGLSLWTHWSRSRRIRWCFVAFAFPLLAIVAHRILAAVGAPLNA